MNEFKISEEHLVLILRYLLSRPMGEVEQIVTLLRKLEKIEKN